MKTLRLLLFLLTLGLVSCTPKVQVVTLHSPNVILQDKAFVYETDSLRLQFNFQGENGVVRMNIYNKLEVPLYIDWKRSAFVKGAEKFNYWVDEAYLRGEFYRNGYAAPSLEPTNRIHSEHYRYSQHVWRSGSIQGIIYKDEPVAFILPKMSIDYARFMVAPGKAWPLPPSRGTVEQVDVSVSESNYKKKKDLVRYEFSEANSPLKFRNYLTLSTDAQFRTEFHIDTPFYASKVENVDGRYLFGSAYSASDLNTPAAINHLPASYQEQNKFLLLIPVN